MESHQVNNKGTRTTKLDGGSP